MLSDRSSDVNDFRYFASRAVLAPRNQHVLEANALALGLLPSEGERTYLSNNRIREGTQDDYASYSVEFLSSYESTGLPPHKLTLRPGALLMLVRNLDFRGGLINGVRCLLLVCMPRVLDVLVLTGPAKGRRVFLPRIPMTAEQNDLPVPLVRRQFPVRLAYAVTVNKAQGQTLDRVGVFLKEPCFSHGQLYVAMSRVRRPADVRILCAPSLVQGPFDAPDVDWVTENVVYDEVLSMAWGADRPLDPPPVRQSSCVSAVVSSDPPPMVSRRLRRKTCPTPVGASSSQSAHAPSSTQSGSAAADACPPQFSGCVEYRGYFETQVGSLCGLHALHNALGLQLFSADDVRDLALEYSVASQRDAAWAADENLSSHVDAAGGNLSLGFLGFLIGAIPRRFRGYSSFDLQGAQDHQVLASPGARGVLQLRPGHWVSYVLQDGVVFCLDSLRAPSAVLPAEWPAMLEAHPAYVLRELL